MNERRSVHRVSLAIRERSVSADKTLKTALPRDRQQSTAQSHWLVPVSINSRSPFASVEPPYARTLVSARTIESLGMIVDDLSSTLTI